VSTSRLSVVTLVTAAVAAAAALAASPASAIAPRPCDIYAAGGTPCVAAHSTTRALYAGYHGSLYRVRRASDRATARIRIRRGGIADAAAQDRFCAHTTCEITAVYDQSPRRNTLTVEGPGSNGGQDVGVVADRLAVRVGGRRAYGMFFEGRMGYRDNVTSGVATGAAPESIYMVTSGEHVNSACCFDYGNVETNGKDTGNGHMHALYFGTACGQGTIIPVPGAVCFGKGPWAQADLENGIFASNLGFSQDPSYTGNTSPFVTAMLKSDRDTFALRDADARAGRLRTHWSGDLPGAPGDVPLSPAIEFPTLNGSATLNFPFTGYRPLKKEGAIVLGTGGDNSNAAVGTFFEGVMTAGRASDATEDAVQRDIVAAHYQAIRPAGSR
jgi:hypothetical protein